jgi:hypothetical protein
LCLGFALGLDALVPLDLGLRSVGGVVALAALDRVGRIEAGTGVSAGLLVILRFAILERIFRNAAAKLDPALLLFG